MTTKAGKERGGGGGGRGGGGGGGGREREGGGRVHSAFMSLIWLAMRCDEIDSTWLYLTHNAWGKKSTM